MKVTDDGSVHQVPVQVSRYLMKPPAIYHPKSALFSSTVQHQENFENFNQLSSFALYLQRNELWEEMHFLERLYYKNKNQHKRAVYFRKIEEVRRIVYRFKEMQIGNLLAEFVELFYGRDQEKQHQKQWDHVPSRDMGFYVLNRLNCAILIMDRALELYLDAYTNFKLLLHQTEFMTLALTVLSIIARLNMLTRVWLSEMKKCCKLLNGWVTCFPV